jgi:hypothetical protein
MLKRESKMIMSKIQWEINVEFIKDTDTNKNFITQAHDFIFKSSI